MIARRCTHHRFAGNAPRVGTPASTASPALGGGYPVSVACFARGYRLQNRQSAATVAIALAALRSCDPQLTTETGGAQRAGCAARPRIGTDRRWLEPVGSPTSTAASPYNPLQCADVLASAARSARWCDADRAGAEHRPRTGASAGRGVAGGVADHPRGELHAGAVRRGQDADRLTLRPDARSHRSAAVVAAIIGAADVTRRCSSGLAAYFVHGARSIPLPAGNADVVVYLVNHDEWKELARAPIKVLTPHGFAKSAVAPTAAMNDKGQLAQRTTTAAAPADRPTFQDLQLSTGVHSTQERGAWVFDGQANAVGVTNRREALRFAQDSTDAPRFDLADYTPSLKRGASSLALGDVTVRSEPISWPRTDSRRAASCGFTSIGDDARLGLSPDTLGGSPEVGWDHLIVFPRGSGAAIRRRDWYTDRPPIPGTDQTSSISCTSTRCSVTGPQHTLAPAAGAVR